MGHLTEWLTYRESMGCAQNEGTGYETWQVYQVG